MAEVKKATLYGPDGQKKAVVVGSAEASQLQARGWGLTPGSYKEKDKQQPQTISQEQQGPLVSMDDVKRKANEMGIYDDSYINMLYYVARDAEVNKSNVYTPEQIDKALQTAIQEASVDLEPYYKEKTVEELEDYKTSLANLRNEALRYKQQEEMSYAQTLQKTKDNLRQRGLTFSGINRKTLGAEGSMDNMGLEGEVPMQRRYNLEDARANFQQRANTAGLEAERKLGSSVIGAVDAGTIPDPYGAYQGGTGITYDPSRLQPIYLPRQVGQTGYRSIGDLEKEKMTALENAAQERFARQVKYLQ